MVVAALTPFTETAAFYRDCVEPLIFGCKTWRPARHVGPSALCGGGRRISSA